MTIPCLWGVQVHAKYSKILENKYSAATTLTYASALCYVHRIASLSDPTKSELIKCALKGYAKINPTLKTRLPITLPILEQVIYAFEHTLSSCFQRKLIRGMFARVFRSCKSRRDDNNGGQIIYKLTIV